MSKEGFYGRNNAVHKGTVIAALLFFVKVVQVCWENQLYDAVIYVFNRGMNDYTTPMEVSAPYIIHTHAFHTDKEHRASQ